MPHPKRLSLALFAAGILSAFPAPRYLRALLTR